MNKKLVSAAVYIAIASGMIAALSVDVPMASARSDQACENALERESKFDQRGELGEDHPNSDRGQLKSHQGVIKSMGDCPVAP